MSHKDLRIASKLSAPAIAVALLVGPAVAADASAAVPAAQNVCGTLDILNREALTSQLHACFERRILPALRRAERDATVLEPAIQAFFGWGRQWQLLGYESSVFASEWDAGMTSLDIAFRNAYQRARERCRRTPGRGPAGELLRIVRQLALLGWSEEELFPSFPQDLAACTKEVVYRVRVRIVRASAKQGVGRDITYTGFLRPKASGEPGELEGSASYSGFIVARARDYWEPGKQACVSPVPPQRITVRGHAEASGMVDLTAPAQGSNSTITYQFETTDWPLKLFESDGTLYARTPQEIEDARALGSWLRVKPVPLAGPVTALTDTRTQPGDRCSGEVTETEEVRIEHMAGGSGR